MEFSISSSSAGIFDMTRTVTLGTMLVLVAAGCSGLRIPSALKMNEGDWPVFGRTPQRVNATTEAVIPPLRVEWEQDISSGMGYGSPIIIDSLLIATNMRGELFIINANTGKRLGWVSIGEAIHGSPVVEGNTVYLALANTRESLVAYNLLEGKIEWRGEFGDIEATPLSYANKLYVGNTAGYFYCIDRFKGEELWRFRLPENKARKGIRSAAALSDSLIIISAEDGVIYALHQETGSRLWSFDTGAPIFASPAINGGSVYCGNINGTLVALDATTGVERWRFQSRTPLYATPSFAEGKLLIGTTGGMLYALDTRDGEPVWSIEINSVINSSAVISGAIAYIGTLKRELLAVRVTDGSIVWQQKLSGRIKTSPAVAYGKLYVATDNRLILALSPEGRQ